MTARLLLGPIVLIVAVALAIIVGYHTTRHQDAAAVPARTFPSRASRSADRFLAAQDPTTTSTTTTTVVVRVAVVARTAPTRPAAHAYTVPTFGGWRALIAGYPWPVATADAIVMCESGGNPNAHNPSGADGLFQILGGPYDPAANVADAYRMWQTRGWQPWTASSRCWS